MTPDVKRAVAALIAKKKALDPFFAYYEGNQPVVYTAERLREIFKRLNVKFVENWSAVVIDACADRINLQRLSVQDKTQQAALDALWNGASLNIELDDTHEAALVAGEAYVIAWPDAEADEIEAYYADPRMCHLFYDPASPRRKKFAAKWWDDEETDRRRLTLYYPDRLEYYVSRKKASDVQNEKSFEPFDEKGTEDGRADNPFGVVPVFHFKNKGCRSDLDNVIPLQNGVNKLLVDEMVTAEYSAFPQRWLISQVDLAETEVTQADGSTKMVKDRGKLKNAPNEIWQLPAGDKEGQGTSVGQLDAANLDGYGKAIGRIVTSIAAISRTPKHYFLLQGGDPSGEALITMESGLNKKAQHRIDRFVPGARQLGAFLLQLQGFAVAPADVTPVYQKPETVLPLTAALVREKDTAVGIPLKTSLRREGWTEAELEQLDKDRAEEAQATQATLASALVTARERFEGMPATMSGRNGGTDG